MGVTRDPVRGIVNSAMEDIEGVANHVRLPEVGARADAVRATEFAITTQVTPVELIGTPGYLGAILAIDNKHPASVSTEIQLFDGIPGSGGQSIFGTITLASGARANPLEFGGIKLVFGSLWAVASGASSDPDFKLHLGVNY